MLRTQTNEIATQGALAASYLSSHNALNAAQETDSFVTAEPTPLGESRRGWRRRRIKRGKS